MLVEIKMVLWRLLGCLVHAGALWLFVVPLCILF